MKHTVKKPINTKAYKTDLRFSTILIKTKECKENKIMVRWNMKNKKHIRIYIRKL